MNESEIQEVIGQYTKHGWSPRRLLSVKPAKSLLASMPPDVKEVRSEIDAIWFSRRSRPDAEAWELRRLTDSPYALVAVLDDGMDEDEMESILEDVQSRMTKTTLGAD